MSSFVAPDRKGIETIWKTNYTIHENLAITVRDTLLSGLLEQKIKTTNVLYRIKKLDSFYDKIVRYRIRSDYLDHIEDVAAVRVVCPYYSDLENTGKIISNNFDVIKHQNKTFNHRVDDSGYQSDHYIIKLPEKMANRLDPFFDENILRAKCEIQVRTILMDAWATVSHDVNYKQAMGLGKDYEREMYALSSLFFFADQRFDSYRILRQDGKQVSTSKEEEIKIDLTQQISSDTLSEYVKQQFSSRPEFKDSACVELTSELNGLNYKTLEEIDKLVKKATPALLQYESDNPPKGMPGTKLDGIGALRICVAIADIRNKPSLSYYVDDLPKYRKIISNGDSNPYKIVNGSSIT